MMNALLGSVSYAAMGAGSLPSFIDASFEFNPVWAPSGYTLSNENKTLTNTTGGSDYTRWVPTVFPIPYLNQIFYWEIHCLATGGTTYDGYFGVTTQANIDSSFYGPLTFYNPIHLGSIAYKGNGQLWGINGLRQNSVTDLATYGQNDIIMFAFNPITKQIWVGKNGVWHRNPETQNPTFYIYYAEVSWYPTIQGRTVNSGGTIKSIPSELTYPIPTNAVALGHTKLFYELSVQMGRVYQVLGKLENGLTVHQSKNYVVVGKSNAALSVHSSQIYLVVDP